MGNKTNSYSGGELRANALSGPNTTLGDQSYRLCTVCGARFKYARGYHRFCSSRCRLLKWAARVIADEYLAGRLPGLALEIEKLR
jgi:hypothetical protein